MHNHRDDAGSYAGKPRGWSLRPARGSDAIELAALVDAAYGHYVERLGMLPGPMTEDYTVVIRDRAVTVAESDEKMTENQALYARIGYAEYERRAGDGFSRVFMRKRLA